MRFYLNKVIIGLLLCSIIIGFMDIKSNAAESYNLYLKCETYSIDGNLERTSEYVSSSSFPFYVYVLNHDEPSIIDFDNSCYVVSRGSFKLTFPGFEDYGNSAKSFVDNNGDTWYYYKAGAGTFLTGCTDKWFVEGAEEIYYLVDENASSTFIEDFKKGSPNYIDNTIKHNLYDTQVIPDMYNTGYKGELIPWREYFELGPETDTCYMDDQKYTYGEVKIGGNDTEWYYFENIDFSDVCVVFHSTSNKHTYFKNCYFGANAPYTVNVQSSNNIMVGFENCTFSNATSAAVGNKNENMIGYLNCLFYDMGADGAKGFNYSQFFNCYFHSIGSTDGSHADGLQNSGDIQALAIKNCRFNCVSYSDFISNACIFLTTNSVSSIKTNVYIEDVYLTGGNYSLYFSNEQTFENPNFEFNNINIGNAAQYGKYSISTDNETKSKIENATKDIDTLYVSSVYEENEKVNLVVSNYTGQERKLLIITNNDSYKITIEACPDYHEGLNNTSLKEFPFDLKVEIPNNLDYIVCYDITDTSNPKQVRFINNTVDSVTVNIESALVDASEITHYESLLPDVVDYDNFLTDNNIEHNQDDYIVIPDKYNTGVPAGVELIPFTEGTVVNGTVLSDDGGNTPVFGYMADRDYNVINYYQNGNMASETIIEGYDFSAKRLMATNIDLYTEKKTIIFKNCKFNIFQSGLSNLYFVFENCTFTGMVEGSNKTLNNCYITANTTDGIHAGSNTFVNNCYVADLFKEPTQTGKHVDGVQIFGDDEEGCENIHFNNVRFSVPDFYYDGTSITYVNAAIMLGMRQSDCDNISFKNIIVDMGGHTFPLYNADSEEFVETNISYKNVRVSDTYDKIFYHTFIEDTVVENVDFNSKLYVSSVWKDVDNKTHIICTNQTKTDKTLKVVTNLGEYSFDIDRSPTQSELLDNDEYRLYTYEDMPYDLEFIINEDIEYMVCYDTSVSADNQIRYVNYNETELPELPENSNPSISGGNISFNANISSWFEVSLPDSCTLKDLENTITFSVSGDIAGDKVLTITTDESLELKNSLDEILTVQTTILKSIFTYLDLKNTENSSISLSVEELPTGRFVGKLPIYISIINEEDIPDDVVTGQVNQNITFRLENDTLTLSGTGDMPANSEAYDEYKENVKTVVIEDGIQVISQKNFNEFTNLETVYFGNTVTTIQKYVFRKCTNMKSVYMPVSVVSVEDHAFPSQTSSTTLYYEGTEEQFNQIQGVEYLTHLTILYNQNW